MKYHAALNLSMRTLRITALFSLIALAAAAQGGMTKEDRQHVVAHLQMTQIWLANEVSSLSPAQLNYRIAPGRWTILEVVEHLNIAEPGYWDSLQTALKQPPSKGKQQATDAEVLWYGIDRTDRQKTSKSEEPKDQVTDIHQALATFDKLHVTMLEYARTTNDDLRSHAFPQWGMDAYQALLTISTHEQRHILQILEIKTDPGYPKT